MVMERHTLKITLIYGLDGEANGGLCSKLSGDKTHDAGGPNKIS